MKTYTVRFRCKARLEDEESTTESDYELQLEAENLEDVYTRLDDYLENWEEGASIQLNAPGVKLPSKPWRFLTQKEKCFIENPGVLHPFSGLQIQSRIFQSFSVFLIFDQLR